MKLFFRVFLLLFFNILFLHQALAIEPANCSGQYVTILNPVRNKDLWKDPNISQLTSQHNLIQKYNLPSTWLLQYDTLFDPEIVHATQNFSTNQEFGVLLEISPALAKQAGVSYAANKPWYDPSVVFLSGYSRSDRLKLIDALFASFKQVYGYYPKTVGAWWLDSYGAQYMVHKYQVNSLLIVADQLTTDNYGVWGQPPGIAYYPDKYNILLPASSVQNKLQALVLQWAPRHLTLGYLGSGPQNSNNSVQANDYLSLGKDLVFFKQVAGQYLNCQNTPNQLTIGLEIGQESVGLQTEFEKQLQYLLQEKKTNFTTPNKYFSIYQQAHPNLSPDLQLGDWQVTSKAKTNPKLNQQINYSNLPPFSDYYLPDSTSFLSRNLNNLKPTNQLTLPLGLVIFLFFSLIIYFKTTLQKTFVFILFYLNLFGFLLLTFYQFGYFVRFDSVSVNLAILFALSLLLSLPTVFFKPNLLLPTVPSLFFLFGQLSFTKLDTSWVLGYLHQFTLTGLSITSPAKIQFFHQELPLWAPSALRHMPTPSTNLLAFVLFPVLAILFNILLNKLKQPKVLVLAIKLFFILLSMYNFLNLFTLTPQQIGS